MPIFREKSRNFSSRKHRY